MYGNNLPTFNTCIRKIFTGDLLDEGKWCSKAEFNYHVNRFKRMFATPTGVETYVVTGNHDVGFHYM